MALHTLLLPLLSLPLHSDLKGWGGGDDPGPCWPGGEYVVQAFSLSAEEVGW